MQETMRSADTQASVYLTIKMVLHALFQQKLVNQFSEMALKSRLVCLTHTHLF